MNNDKRRKYIFTINLYFLHTFIGQKLLKFSRTFSEKYWNLYPRNFFFIYYNRTKASLWVGFWYIQSFHFCLDRCTAERYENVCRICCAYRKAVLKRIVRVYREIFLIKIAVYHDIFQLIYMNGKIHHFISFATNYYCVFV